MGISDEGGNNWPTGSWGEPETWNKSKPTTMAGDTYMKYSTEVAEIEELYNEAVEELNKLRGDNWGTVGHPANTVQSNLLTIKNIAVKALKKQS